MSDPKLDNERPWDHGYRYDDFYFRACDAPDPECQCEGCRQDRGELINVS